MIRIVNVLFKKKKKKDVYVFPRCVLRIASMPSLLETITKSRSPRVDSVPDFTVFDKLFFRQRSIRMHDSN